VTYAVCTVKPFQNHGAADALADRSTRRLISRSTGEGTTLMKLHACLVVLVLGAAPLAVRPGGGQSAGRPATLETLLDRAARLAEPLVDAKITVGFAIGILKDGKSAVRGVGRIGKDDDRVPDGDTVYEIGSISKVFTGILLAEAVDLGLVKLSDPVEKHLPEEVTVPAFDGEKIQLVHLATHTAALPRMPGNFRPKDPGNPYADYDTEALYECLSALELSRAPGKAWAYSNLGVGLLGHVLTRVHEKERYEEILVRITRPLELSDTAITLNESMQRRLAPPYRAGGTPSRNWDLNVLAGAGAIRSTANDLLRFARLNLASEDADGKIMKALAASHRPRFQPSPAQRKRGMPGMGLGWILRGDVIWHNGGTGGYRAHLLIHRKERFAVVVLANTTSEKTDALARNIGRLILGREVKPIPVRKAVPVAPAVLKRYVGEYRLSPAAKFTVTRVEDRLFVQLTGQDAFPVYAVSETRFFYRVVPAEIVFNLDGDGKVESLTLFQGGRELRATRIEPAIK